MRHALAPHHIAELQSILLDVDGGPALADGGSLSIERLVPEADRERRLPAASPATAPSR